MNRRTLTKCAWSVATQLQKDGVCSARFAMKWMPKNIRKPLRKTDLCAHCEDLHKARRRETGLLKQLRAEYPHADVNINTLYKWARCSDVNVFVRMRCEMLLMDLETLEHHKAHALRQKVAWERLVTDITSGVVGDVVAIGLDYKENWALPLKKRTIKKEFFKTGQTPVSSLGFVVYMPGLEPRFFDVLTDNLGHGGYEACAGFRTLLAKLSTFPEFRQAQRLEVWGDCGVHFRGAEFAYCTLIEQHPCIPPIRSLNFFGEHHGKCRVDSHFGRETNFVRKAVLHGEDILDSDHLAEVLGRLEGVTVLRPDREDVDASGGPRQKPKRMRLEVDLIQSTYCLRVGPENLVGLYAVKKHSRAARTARYCNASFSDVALDRGQWMEAPSGCSLFAEPWNTWNQHADPSRHP